MAKVSKQTAAKAPELGAVQSYKEEIDDGYTINFVSFSADVDATDLLKGLPGDSCQCPHWGYVIKGKLVYRFADRDEQYEAGDAFYLPPGHIPIAYAGCEFVQFSPTDELRVVHAAMHENAARLQQA